MSSLKPLSGKVALVTGASRGIGKAIALKLASDGAKIVVNYAGNAAAAEEVVKQIGSEHAIAIKANAGSVSEITTLIDSTIQHYGKLDILVACAGIMPLNELEKVTEEEFDNIFNLNVKGPMFLAQKATPHMAPGSRIILFSTTLCAASTVTPNYLAYVSSKGAIEQMTRVMSKDLARKGIMVNCVAPGPTGTELFMHGKSEQVLKMIAGFNPQGRIGRPEEIAGVVGFLVGEGSSWVTGQMVRVNGGMA
ncbi:NAD(P)-binding protein [Hyaloscypha bicolor E]|uniref:NAD(P)-binding protein n=1 Tax=Hyaloscypha bicolor E TaxID=1095630 RepID=A0A2J6TFG1_9HELO|nr:NAD(P)-binding protein [Hyaloscypha bicolor E]PMD61771.1 NAD(P)-binding protein [Hyaloscypha bicolor E]